MKIKFETAYLAHRKGFDGASYNAYNYKEDLIDFRDSGGTTPQRRSRRMLYIACEQHELQTWLREKGVMVEVNFYTHMGNVEYIVEVCHQLTWHEKTEFRKDTFSTYENALERGLKEGLLLLE